MATGTPGSRSGTTALGQRGERAALAAYARLGYRLVAANWRCPLGEIDLIVVRDGVLVFCEVKTRRGSSLGGPFEAVTAAKQRRLRTLASAYMAGASNGNGTDASRAGIRSDAAIRFDVASVMAVGSREAGGLRVELFEDAF